MVSTKISVFRRLTCSNRGSGATSETSWRSDGRHRSANCLAAVRVHELMCTATATRARAGSVDCIQACMPSPCAMDLYKLCFKAICLTQTDPVDFDQDQQPEAPPDRKVDDVDQRRRIQSRFCSVKEEEDTRRRKEKKTNGDTPPPPSAGQTACSGGGEANRAVGESPKAVWWRRLRSRLRRPGRL